MKLELALLFLAALTSSCKSLNGGRERSLDELRYPGYIDIGVGFGVAFDTRNAKDDNARGTLVSLKAYPGGRWYSTLRAQGAKEITDAISTLTVNAVEKSNDDAAVPADKDKPDAPSIEEITTRLLKAREQVLSDEEYYVVNDRNRIIDRFSVFYGISAGEFTGGGLESTTHVVGVGYDWAPQLAFLVGWAFYDVGLDDDVSTDSGPFFGISLNLNAFKSLTSATSSW